MLKQPHTNTKLLFTENLMISNFYDQAGFAACVIDY